MAGKPLGKDAMGIQKTMRFGDYLGDGLGQLPLNVMANLVGQLTYFYTERSGLPQVWWRPCCLWQKL